LDDVLELVEYTKMYAIYAWIRKHIERVVGSALHLNWYQLSFFIFFAKLIWRRLKVGGVCVKSSHVVEEAL
jgi:hypothetical protein